MGMRMGNAPPFYLLIESPHSKSKSYVPKLGSRAHFHLESKGIGHWIWSSLRNTLISTFTRPNNVLSSTQKDYRLHPANTLGFQPLSEDRTPNHFGKVTIGHKTANWCGSWPFALFVFEDIPQWVFAFCHYHGAPRVRWSALDQPSISPNCSLILILLIPFPFFFNTQIDTINFLLIIWYSCSYSQQVYSLFLFYWVLYRWRTFHIDVSCLSRDPTLKKWRIPYSL